MKISLINIILIGIIFRISLFIILSIAPYYHEIFGSISPVSFHYFADYGMYKNFGEGPNGVGDIFSIDQFLNNYKNVLLGNFELVVIRYPGIFFTILIYLTNYSANFTIAMSLLTFAAEILAFILWANFFFKKYDRYAALIFSFLPIPLVFGFFHSSDTFFYLFSTIIFLYLKNFLNFNKNYLILFFFIILSTIRPASIILLVFSFLYSFFDKRFNKNFKIFLFLIIIFTIFYYSQYFIFETSKLKNQVYLSNFLNLNLDNFFNVFIYSIMNFFYKIVLMLGFIKSDSGNIYFYSVRSFMAVILIIGYFFSFTKKYDLEFFYINFLIISVSVFLYPAYRYSLPITPILYIYAYQSFKDIIIKKQKTMIKTYEK